MSEVTIEQALYERDLNSLPALMAQSAGLAESALDSLQDILIAFGQRPAGVACPLIVFAQPFGKGTVAIGQIADLSAGGKLGYRFLIVPRGPYEKYWGDPFYIADRFPPSWSERGELPALHLPAEPMPPRKVADVQAILRRVKHDALQPGENPHAVDFQHTVENSESPLFLGAAQILVDGGKLVFERSQPASDLVRALWTLLPQSTRCHLWPTTFAFNADSGFDLLVIPAHLNPKSQTYVTEEQALDYPQGAYEFALQSAAENGDEKSLVNLFNRRSGAEITRAGLTIIVFLTIALLLGKFFETPPSAESDRLLKAAAVAGMVGAGDPYIDLAIYLHGKTVFNVEK